MAGAGTRLEDKGEGLKQACNYLETTEALGRHYGAALDIAAGAGGVKVPSSGRAEPVAALANVRSQRSRSVLGSRASRSAAS